jgi:Fe-S-cluster-containing hydrogenase component 2
MVKILLINPVECRGCRRCELACSFYKEGEANHALSRIHVFPSLDSVSTIQVVCQQCDTPFCLYACPVNAITKDNDKGTIMLDQEKCVGCLSCFILCPLGGIFLHPTKKLPLKCDLCEGEPKCVIECPYNAIEFVELDELSYLKRIQSLAKLYENFLNMIFVKR